jgi:hypothetical protein
VIDTAWAAGIYQAMGSAVEMSSGSIGNTMDNLGHAPQIAVLVLSILVLAFFSSSRASLILVNKFRIRHLAIIV